MLALPTLEYRKADPQPIDWRLDAQNEMTRYNPCRCDSNAITCGRAPEAGRQTMHAASRTRTVCIRVLQGLVLAAWLVVPGIRADDTAGPDDSARIAKLIEQLGSDAFGEREAAVNALRKIGVAAREHLLDARHHKSAEVRSRAAALVRQQDVFPLVEAFQAFAQQPEEKLDLEEGMWLISRILNKDVQRVPLAKQLDALADAVRKKLGRDVVPKSVEPERLVNVLREVLFTDEKFGGNVDDYQNPSNSSLEKVLQTKRGLPIVVSHLVIAVGRRLDVPIVGVPTGGRYIVKYDGRKGPGAPRQDIYFDPFDNGKLLTREDRAAMFPDSIPTEWSSPNRGVWI